MFSMKLSMITLLIWSILLGGGLLAEYRSYELGFNAKGKTKIVEDMLSEEGKLYVLRPGSIFVVDKVDILNRIGEILKDLEGNLPSQIQLSLRRALQGETKKRSFDLGVKVEGGKGSLRLGLGDEKSTKRQNTTTQLTTLSGERATLRLETNEGRLKYWRGYFLPTVEKVTSESEVLEILPVLSGQRVRATIHSLYTARVKGKELTFKTGEVQSQVILNPGSWTSLGGLMSEGEEAKRRNFGLSRAGEEKWEDLKLEVKAEVLRPEATSTP